MTDMPEARFLNHYECPCGCAWTDDWSCACNDRCPECNREIEPHESVELTEEETGA